MICLLTAQRHHANLQQLKENKIIKVQQTVKSLQASESTIRRDLAQLEKENKLKRVHGRATLIQQIKDAFMEKAKADPVRVIPSIIVGSSVAGGLSMLFNIGLPVPHGEVEKKTSQSVRIFDCGKLFMLNNFAVLLHGLFDGRCGVKVFN